MLEHALRKPPLSLPRRLYSPAATIRSNRGFELSLAADNRED
jgi:hypothetical protein